MRSDASQVLQYLGFTIDRDFITYAEPDGSCRLVWRSAQAQPSDATIAAVTQAQIDAAKATAEATSFPERTAMRQAAASAITDLDTFFALTTPTNAQVVAVVKRMCQINKQLIKRVIQLD